MAKVYFKEGSQDDYNSVTPDENSFYKVENNDSSDEDEFDVYLGGIQLNNGRTIASLIAQIEDLDQRVYDLENPPTLIGNYTAAQVWSIVNAGEAENYWSVGDVTNPIELNGTVGICEFDHESYRAMIIDFDHNTDLETDRKYSMTLQFGQNEDGVNIAFIDSNYNSNGSSASFRMNTSNTNSGGWENSYMRNTICPQFLEVLPNSLQNVIGTTTKYTDNVGAGSGSVESNVTATEDKIFLLAEQEVFSSSSYSNTYEGNYQERYAWYTANDSDSARVRYRHSSPSSTSIWWLRSPYWYSSYIFCSVISSGYASNSNARYSYGLAPAFTIIGSSPYYKSIPITLEIQINGTSSSDSYEFNMSLTDENKVVLPISATMEIDNKKIAITNGKSDNIILPDENRIYYMYIPKVINDPYCMIEISTGDADSSTLYIGGIAQIQITRGEAAAVNFSLDPDGVEITVVCAYRDMYPI